MQTGCSLDQLDNNSGTLSCSLKFNPQLRGYLLSLCLQRFPNFFPGIDLLILGFRDLASSVLRNDFIFSSQEGIINLKKKKNHLTSCFSPECLTVRHQASWVVLSLQSFVPFYFTFCYSSSSITFLFDI